MASNSKFINLSKQPVKPSSNFFPKVSAEPKSEAEAFFTPPTKLNAVNQLGAKFSKLTLGATAITPDKLVAVKPTVAAPRGPFSSRSNPLGLMSTNPTLAPAVTAFSSPAARKNVAATANTAAAAKAAAERRAAAAAAAAPFTAAAMRRATVKHKNGGKRRSTRRRRSKTSKKRRSQ
jgi:hypothetical protein